MNKLYVFAIGGSGERVMYSMLMMLAAGMPIKADTIIPVFVDNDVNSNALNKCKKLISYYRGSGKDNEIGLHSLYNGMKSDDFPSFAQAKVDEPCSLNIAGGAVGTLNNIIGDIDTDNVLENAIAEERDLLFTRDDLDMPLDVGFVGNPNIGTVVLNSLSLQGDSFNNILGGISSNDGVIVLGSLFGGTGAAGFPLIINKFHTDDPTKCPLLGGVAVLPYFTLTDKDGTQDLLDTTRWDVKCETFDAKTRAALMYYADYMKQMDYLYYVGDNNRRQYDHYLGGAKQDNPVNMIEVMAALSVFDFAKQTKPSNIVYKRPQWQFNDDCINSNVSGILNKDLQKALVKFQMLKILFYNDKFLQDDIQQKRPHVANIGVEIKHITACTSEQKITQFTFAWGLCHIFLEWEKWINDLSDQNAKRKLNLFNSNEKAISPENITQLFFADNDNFGIAKVNTKIKGIISTKTEKIPSAPDITNELVDAYRKLSDKKIDAKQITDDKRLGILLQIISRGLDKVLKKNTIINQ